MKEKEMAKICQWLKCNFYHESTMCDCIAYKHEDTDIDKMIDDFKQWAHNNL